jgi:hypothetical protein
VLRTVYRIVVIATQEVVDFFLRDLHGFLESGFHPATARATRIAMPTKSPTQIAVESATAIQPRT